MDRIAEVEKGQWIFGLNEPVALDQVDAEGWVWASGGTITLDDEGGVTVSLIGVGASGCYKDTFTPTFVEQAKPPAWVKGSYRGGPAGCTLTITDKEFVPAGQNQWV